MSHRISLSVHHLSILIVVLALVSPVSAQVIRFVDASATGGNTGLDWINAYTDLQAALSAAPGVVDEIWVAAGTYTPGPARTASFAMINGVAIYGGFDGTEDPATFDLAARDFETNETILSGDIGTIGVDTDNCYHVFYHPSGTNLNSTAVLDGVTITGGNANSAYPYGYGGGMFNDSSSPTLVNCKFKENRANYDGGGIYNYGGGSNPKLSNCTFSGNFGMVGGGMHNFGGSPMLTDCIFIMNVAGTGGGFHTTHGGIGAGSPTLTHCTFEGNIASDVYYGLNGRLGFGGGMYHAYGHATLNDCTFTDNSANTCGGLHCNDKATVTGCTFNSNSADNWGGAVITYGTGVITLTDCEFNGNTAGLGGGVYCHSKGSFIIQDSVFRENSASHGGAICSEETGPKVINGLFEDNEAENGGAMRRYGANTAYSMINCIFRGNNAIDHGVVYDSTGGGLFANCLFDSNWAKNNGGVMSAKWALVANCTFVNNSATTYGAIRVGPFNGMILANSILWGNSDSSGTGESAQIGLDGYSPTINYSCVQGWTGSLGGVGNMGDDPSFVYLAGGNLHLFWNSPCIDAGNNTSVPAGVTTDLDGETRFFDGDNNGVSTVDMGAYEFQPWPQITVAVSVKTHGSAGDFAIDVLDRTDNLDIECRRYGVTKLLVEFDVPIWRINYDLTDVVLSSGTVTAINPLRNGIMIEMTGTTNAELLIVSFPGVAYRGNNNYVVQDTLCIRQLVGDVEPDGVITALDRVKVRDAMVSSVDASNFRYDVEADGVFTALDRVIVRDAMTTGIVDSCP